MGAVAGTHGKDGTLKVRIYSNDPEHLLSVDAFRLGDEAHSRSVSASQLHAGQLLLTLDGITNPEDASRFLGVPVRLGAQELRPLEPNEFFIYQLLGLGVETDDGERIGTVTDLIETGANDVLVVTPREGGSDILLPLIPTVVLDVDPANGVVVARPLRYYGDA